MGEVAQMRFGGFGGQGIVLMGAILGDAAVRDGLWAAGSNSYGPQARGSACRSEVILSGEPVDFPHVLEADVLAVMSQEAYERFLPQVRGEGVVIHDHPGVRPSEKGGARHVAIPATRTALEQLRNAQVANMVLLAAAVALTGVVSKGSLREALKEGVPSTMREINHEALELGFALGKGALSRMGGRFFSFSPKRPPAA